MWNYISLSSGGFGKNVVIFDADMRSSVHVNNNNNNNKKDILILGPNAIIRQYYFNSRS